MIRKPFRKEISIIDGDRGRSVACPRGVYRMKQRGRRGCLTVFDVAPADLSPLSPEELRAHML